MLPLLFSKVFGSWELRAVDEDQAVFLKKITVSQDFVFIK